MRTVPFLSAILVMLTLFAAGCNGSPPETAERALSPEECAKVLSVIERVDRLIEAIEGGRTPIDPRSDEGREILNDLEAVRDDLQDVWTSGGCGGGHGPRP